MHTHTHSTIWIHKNRIRGHRHTTLCMLCIRQSIVSCVCVLLTKTINQIAINICRSFFSFILSDFNPWMCAPIDDFMLNHFSHFSFRSNASVKFQLFSLPAIRIEWVFFTLSKCELAHSKPKWMWNTRIKSHSHTICTIFLLFDSFVRSNINENLLKSNIERTTRIDDKNPISRNKIEQ